MKSKLSSLIFGTLSFAIATTLLIGCSSAQSDSTSIIQAEIEEMQNSPQELPQGKNWAEVEPNLWIETGSQGRIVGSYADGMKARRSFIEILKKELQILRQKSVTTQSSSRIKSLTLLIDGESRHLDTLEKLEVRSAVTTRACTVRATAQRTTSGPGAKASAYASCGPNFVQAEAQSSQTYDFSTSDVDPTGVSAVALGSSANSNGYASNKFTSAYRYYSY